MGAWVTAFLLVPAVAAPVVSPTEPASSISVDFRVIDERGRPVVDLRPEEVLIADDDSARTMSALRFVGAGDPDASRVIAFFLDEYHVAPADTTSVRQALRRFIEEYVEPTDHLVVLKPLESLGALQTMRGPRRVLEAVATFEGRRGDYSPRNAFERNYIAADAGRIDTVRAQIAVSALQALVTQVGRVTRNRKALVVVSEGFRVPIAGRGSGLPTIDSLIRSANQASVSLYPVEPVALRAGAVPSSPRVNESPDLARGMLRHLAVETRGGAAERPSDSTGWERVVGDLSHYYVATFSGAVDGRFHPLTVRVTRRAARVIARPGYWARPPEGATPVGVNGLRGSRSTLATAPVPALRSSRLFNSWFGAARGDDGRTRVTFAWEPAARSVGERVRPPAVARVSLTVYAADGTELLRRVVRSTGTAEGVEPPSATFEAHPGRLRVQLDLEDAAARVLDTDVRDLTIPPLNGGVAIGTPSVIRTRTARDRRAASTDLTTAPAVSREFTRQEHLLIRFPVYAERPVTVTATLAGRSGRPLRSLPATRRGDTDVYELDLPLAPFATGEYSIQLMAAAEVGSVHETVPLRIVP